MKTGRPCGAGRTLGPLPPARPPHTLYNFCDRPEIVELAQNKEDPYRIRARTGVCWALHSRVLCSTRLQDGSGRHRKRPSQADPKRASPLPRINTDAVILFPMLLISPSPFPSPPIEGEN